MSFPELATTRERVAGGLRRACRAKLADRSKLFGVKGEALAAATATNRDVLVSPTMPAIERYSGVLYQALDHGSLSARDRRRLDAQVVIFSGLMGLVAPSDPIPDYKLKMGASLPGVGKVSTAWRPHVDAALTHRTAGRTVWNLLPNEHAAAWSGADPSASEITVRFVDDVERNGARTLVTVSHWNKLLKGALVRHVLDTQLREPDGLAGFEHPQGYVYRPELTETVGGRTTVTLVARR